jgi:2-amino-4-hydroxy-6-hydroxymethyldihydropteridine diphosphokinase
MAQHNAYVALGSNLNDPLNHLLSALSRLNRSNSWQLVSYSSLYGSKPMGPQDQPDYVNAVCQLETELSAYDLLQSLHDIEDEFGRKRIRHWGERTLDLDLLLFDNETHQNPDLRVPHPGLYERSFVLYPLAEITPALVLPNGKTVTEQAKTLTESGLDVLVYQSSISL